MFVYCCALARYLFPDRRIHDQHNTLRNNREKKLHVSAGIFLHCLLFDFGTGTSEEENVRRSNKIACYVRPALTADGEPDWIVDTSGYRKLNGYYLGFPNRKCIDEDSVLHMRSHEDPLVCGSEWIQTLLIMNGKSRDFLFRSMRTQQISSCVCSQSLLQTNDQFCARSYEFLF